MVHTQLTTDQNPNWIQSAINDWVSTERDQTHVTAHQPSRGSTTLTPMNPDEVN